MTRDTMRNNMYIDDVIFSAQSLIKAEIIAQEAIELFDSRDFKLVQWSANRQSLFVWADLDKLILIFRMRGIELSQVWG